MFVYVKNIVSFLIYIKELPNFMEFFPHIRRKSLNSTGKYTIKKKLGSGSFGCVFLITNNIDGFQYAMKRLETRNVRTRDDYRRLTHEMNILYFNRCPYLLHALDIEFSKDQYKVDLISELFAGGSLDNFIHKHRVIEKLIPKHYIWSIFLQIAMGIEYLHRNGIIHRDLKPANILLDNKDVPNRVAICDFGASICLANGEKRCHTKIGTPYFMSPEQYNSIHYDKRTDVWSLGCILYELITGEKPFTAPNIVMLNYKISRGQYKPLNFKDNNSDYLIWSEIIKRTIEKDLSKRISIGALLGIPQIKEKIKELGLHHEKRPFFDLPLTLQNRNISNNIQLSNYINDLKNELGTINNQNISLTSSLRNEYRPSPIKFLNRPSSDSNASPKPNNNLFVPLPNFHSRNSLFKPILKPLPAPQIKKPFAVRLKNIVENNRSEENDLKAIET